MTASASITGKDGKRYAYSVDSIPTRCGFYEWSLYSITNGGTWIKIEGSSEGSVTASIESARHALNRRLGI